jgi:hypothetical protein
VVSCLFSSICHAQTPAGLAEAVARMRAPASGRLAVGRALLLPPAMGRLTRGRPR